MTMTLERPRQRLLHFGPEVLSNTVLLSVLLQGVGLSAPARAQALLNEEQGLASLLQADAVTLRRKGFEATTTSTLLVGVELRRDHVCAALEIGVLGHLVVSLRDWSSILRGKK